MGQSKICFAKSYFVRLGQLRSQEYRPRNPQESASAMRSGHEVGSISWAAIGQIHILPIALRLAIQRDVQFLR
jgi:hypothetical protein